MKVLLDIDKLKSEGKLSAEECKRLHQYAKEEASSLIFNILLIFGGVGATWAWVEMVPSAISNLVMGLLIGFLGFWWMRKPNQWSAAALICRLLGTLLVCYGVLNMGEYSQLSWLITTAVLAAVGLITRQGLLMVFAVLASPGALLPIPGTHTEMFSVLQKNAFFTSLLYVSLSLLFYCIWGSWASSYKRVSAYAAGTCFVVANIALLNGSICIYEQANIYSDLYATALTLFLIISSVVAVKTKNRWLFNTSAFFMFINIFSKWTAVNGFSVANELFLSIIALLIAVVIRYYNQQMNK